MKKNSKKMGVFWYIDDVSEKQAEKKNDSTKGF